MKKLNHFLNVLMGSFFGVFVGMTLDWLDAGMSYDLSEAGARIRRLLTDETLRGQLPQFI